MEDFGKLARADKSRHQYLDGGKQLHSAATGRISNSSDDDYSNRIPVNEVGNSKITARRILQTNSKKIIDFEYHGSEILEDAKKIPDDGKLVNIITMSSSFPIIDGLKDSCFRTRQSSILRKEIP